MTFIPQLLLCAAAAVAANSANAALWQWRAKPKLRSMSDLVVDAIARPGEVAFGLWGVGNPDHLSAE